ncbi:MAG: sensor histidine kinase [Candidatus Thorarchaeota archaeon]|jgi:signal transduction histidine kinase
MNQNGGRSPQETRHALKRARRQIRGRRLETRGVKPRENRVVEEAEIISSIITHELGNDLQIILGNIEAIDIEKIGEVTGVSRRIASISAAANRMVNLLDALRLRTEIRDGTVLDMLLNAAEVAQDIHSGMRVNLNISDDFRNASLPCYRLLKIVFENLFRNSAEHCGEEVVVDISASLDFSNAVIEFSDDGPGVRADLHSKIFQKGVSRNGRGLGLYLSQKLLGIYNGKIEILPSQEGHGARFQITIPIET